MPDELLSLQHFTTFGPDGVNNAVSVFLGHNSIETFPSILVRVQNISTLSIRNNMLQELPKDIFLLQNLRELNVGGNQLPFLPYELERLPKLKTVSVFPNPFVEPCESPTSPVLSLMELSMRVAHKNKLLTEETLLERHLRLNAHSNHQCCVCSEPVFFCYHWRIVRKEFRGSTNVSIRYVYCSKKCMSAHTVSLTNDAATPNAPEVNSADDSTIERSPIPIETALISPQEPTITIAVEAVELAGDHPSTSSVQTLPLWTVVQNPAPTSFPQSEEIQHPEHTFTLDVFF